MRKGQSDEAMKQNSGSIARFIQHACRPNVQFAKMQNRTQVKVRCRMISTVDVGARVQRPPKDTS
ncbi:hypothetical protein PF003_g6543 [Phytophthora fragariae]|nr:hypothetical protein PF003_g6543 [Phytophthora fragariae]